MDRFAKVFCWAVLAASASTSFGAGVSVVGKWTGHFQAIFAPPPGNKSITPDQVKQLNSILSGIKIVVTIKADGTYMALTKGPKQADQKTKGRWKLKGKELTLTPSEAGLGPETGNVAADGKSITMSLPKGMSENGVKGHAIFRRA